MKEVHPLFRHPAVLGVILVLYAFLHFPADELSDQKRSRSPDFKGHQQLLAWHVSVFSWLHRDSGAAALHFAHTALTKTWLYSPMGLKAVGLGAILL